MTKPFTWHEFENVTLPAIVNIVHQQMPDEYVIALKWEGAAPSDTEPRDGELFVKHAQEVLPADKWSIVSSAKLQIVLTEEIRDPKTAAALFLDVIGKLVESARTFTRQWDKQVGVKTNALKAATDWEKQMRFNCALALRRLVAELPVQLSLQLRVAENSTEIISPTMFTTKARLTVSDAAGQQVFAEHLNLFSSEDNSINQIADYFLKHTDLLKIAQQHTNLNHRLVKEQNND